MKKIIAVIGVLAMLLTACGTSSLVGLWKAPGSDRRLEFFSDGTYSSSDANYHGGYSVDGNRIKLQGDLMPDKTYTFKVQGDSLTLYNDDGKLMYEYNKVK